MLTKGPFIIKWANIEIEDIEDIEIEHDIETKDLKISPDKTIEVDESYKVTATVTLLATDIPSLAVLLPQHFVPYGGTLSTGELVNKLDGAIDLKRVEPESGIVGYPLDIISCGDPQQVTRIVNARTKIDGVEITNKIQKIKVKFSGEALPQQASMQFFREEDAAIGYLLIHEDGGKLLLGDGGKLLL